MNAGGSTEHLVSLMTVAHLGSFETLYSVLKHFGVPAIAVRWNSFLQSFLTVLNILLSPRVKTVGDKMLKMAYFCAVMEIPF